MASSHVEWKMVLLKPIHIGIESMQSLSTTFGNSRKLQKFLRKHFRDPAADFKALRTAPAAAGAIAGVAQDLLWSILVATEGRVRARGDAGGLGGGQSAWRRNCSVRAIGS
jgi:hypothetical protein